MQPSPSQDSSSEWMHFFFVLWLFHFPLGNFDWTTNNLSDMSKTFQLADRRHFLKLIVFMDLLLKWLRFRKLRLW
jgi:hypothetical protein